MVKKGKKHGVEKEYFRNGRLRSLRTFKEGELHGLKQEFYEDGRLESQWTWKNGILHGPYRERDFNDDDGDCDEAWCDSPVINPGDQNLQNGIDEDPPDIFNNDDDGDGKVDEDREGGFSEPETQVIEYLTWRLDIYDDYPQNIYLEDYQKGIILETPNLTLLQNINLKDELECRTSLPVYIENDANLFALGEWKKQQN